MSMRCWVRPISPFSTISLFWSVAVNTVLYFHIYSQLSYLYLYLLFYCQIWVRRHCVIPENFEAVSRFSRLRLSAMLVFKNWKVYLSVESKPGASISPLTWPGSIPPFLVLTPFPFPSLPPFLHFPKNPARETGCKQSGAERWSPTNF